MIHVDAEITGMILRFSDTPDAQTYSGTMFVLGNEGVATIKAAMSVPPGAHNAVRRALRERGFHTMRWSHHLEDGTVEWVEFRLVPKGS